MELRKCKHINIDVNPSHNYKFSCLNILTNFIVIGISLHVCDIRFERSFHWKSRLCLKLITVTLLLFRMLDFISTDEGPIILSSNKLQGSCHRRPHPLPLGSCVHSVIQVIYMYGLVRFMTVKHMPYACFFFSRHNGATATDRKTFVDI